MSKTSSGLFSGTAGNKSGNTVRLGTSSQIESTLHERVKAWAKQKQNELTGKTKKNYAYQGLIFKNSKSFDDIKTMSDDVSSVC